MISASASASLWFLIFTAPICFWVMWSDMAFMKIPNKAVMAALAVFVVVGPFVLPFDDYLWRYVHVILVITVGFVASMGGLIGAGDAKFAAAMAPFVAVGDIFNILYLFAAILLTAFVSHRAMKHFPPFRNQVPQWKSWSHGKFPMGLALGGTLAAYLAMAARYGAAAG
ncbi:prepilin peptidase [Alphaproteobacteria bacterium KMM 3653]|uniref:Prepilin peptidase n=1 Tax=Harenicola maris TaxID=2841044 RepID=A0AAP2CQR6_9RHOB|nr:prepilin peptidase [Harenicola maris]